MKFKLEAFLNERTRYKTPLSADIQRDVERLIWKGDQTAAYNLYCTDADIDQLTFEQFCIEFPIDPPALKIL